MSLVVLGVPVVAQNVNAYNTVAASMFFFWDYLLTFGDEVELIWRPKLTGVSILFYFIRYMAFFIRIVHLVFCSSVFGLLYVSPASCTIWRWFQVMSGQFLFLAVELLLILRVFAFYGRNRILLAVLLLFLAVEISAMVVIVTVAVPKSVAISNPFRNIHGAPCVGVSFSKYFSDLWIPPLIMQSVLSILVAWKFATTRTNSTKDSPLLKLFVRDHAWAFFLIFAICLWSTLAYELKGGQGEVALTWNYSVLGFCGSRLLLNLRAAAQTHKENSGSTTFDASEIVFTSHFGFTTYRGAISANTGVLCSDGRDSE